MYTLHTTVGAPIAGRLSDKTITQWRHRRRNDSGSSGGGAGAGKWVPEDRLRATLGAAGVLVPLSVLVSGFATQFVRDPFVGIGVNLVCLFCNGLGVRGGSDFDFDFGFFFPYTFWIG